MKHINKNLHVLFLLLLSSFSATAQFDFQGEASIKAMGSTNEKMPFWMHSNQRGRVTDSTNLVSWITGKGFYEITENSSFEIGAGFLFQDANNKAKINIDELYGKYKNSWFQLILGRKQKPELYNGLSASNENIIYSLNSRPFPGIQLRTVSPIKISSKFAVKLEWEEFLLEKDGYIKNARLHHKSFQIQFKPNENWTIKYGLQHFAQWGGTRPNGIEEPQGFSDYLRIFSLRGGGENASQPDVENVLGNHLGSHELYVTRKFNDYSVEFLFNNLFEDGSGSWFGNFPDGRYGVYFSKTEKNNIINSFIYEFYYTKDQSKDTRWGEDNYFNNGPTYHSGWTYYNRVIGTPFFRENPDGFGIKDSKFVAHHIGIGGQFSTYFEEYPYKMMVSYIRYNNSEDNLHLYLNSRVFNGFLNVNLNLAADFSSNYIPTYGVGVQISKDIF